MIKQVNTIGTLQEVRIDNPAKNIEGYFHGWTQQLGIRGIIQLVAIVEDKYTGKVIIVDEPEKMTFTQTTKEYVINGTNS